MLIPLALNGTYPLLTPRFIHVPSLELLSSVTLTHRLLKLNVCKTEFLTIPNSAPSLHVHFSSQTLNCSPFPTSCPLTHLLPVLLDPVVLLRHARHSAAGTLAPPQWGCPSCRHTRGLCPPCFTAYLHMSPPVRPPLNTLTFNILPTPDPS